MEKLRLTIAGEEYSIATDNEPEYVIDLASKVDEKITGLIGDNYRISLTQAAVITCLEYLEELDKTKATAENLRSQIKSYLEDAARAKADYEMAKKEIEKLKKELRQAR